MPPRTTFALADRQKDSCLHPSRPKRNIIQKEKAGNAPSLAHEKGHRQTDRQTHRQTTTTLIASGPPLRGDPYFVCISTTLLRNYRKFQLPSSPSTSRNLTSIYDEMPEKETSIPLTVYGSSMSCLPLHTGDNIPLKRDIRNGRIRLMLVVRAQCLMPS